MGVIDSTRWIDASFRSTGPPPLIATLGRREGEETSRYASPDALVVDETVVVLAAGDEPPPYPNTQTHVLRRPPTSGDGPAHRLLVIANENKTIADLGTVLRN